MKIVFKSGRSITPNCGIVGIGPELGVSEGYDNGMDWPPIEWGDGVKEEDALTADDMRELADLMIDRWQRFKAGLDGQADEVRSDRENVRRPTSKHKYER